MIDGREGDGFRQLAGHRHAVDGGALRSLQRQPFMQILGRSRWPQPTVIRRSDCLVSAGAAEQPHLGDDRPIGCLKLQPVLAHCPFDAGRQIERLPCLESFDVLQHVP